MCSIYSYIYDPILHLTTCSTDRYVFPFQISFRFVSSLCVANLLLGLIVLPGLVLVDTLSPASFQSSPGSISTSSQSALAAAVHDLLRQRDGLSPGSTPALHSPSRGTLGTLSSSWSSSSNGAQAVGCETIVFLTLWFSIKNVLTSMMIALDR